jgi:hypothetical protein
MSAAQALHEPCQVIEKELLVLVGEETRLAVVVALDDVFRESIASEIKRWARVVKAADIKAR